MAVARGGGGRNSGPPFEGIPSTNRARRAQAPVLTGAEQLFKLQERWAREHPGRDVASEMALCFDLTQSTDRQVIFDGVLPTLRSTRSLLWSPASKRWLTYRERAACMGYPVYSDLAASAMIDLDTATLERPRYAIGNAVHVANVGAALALALMATEPLSWKPVSF